MAVFYYRGWRLLRRKRGIPDVEMALLKAVQRLNAMSEALFE